VAKVTLLYDRGHIPFEEYGAIIGAALDPSYGFSGFLPFARYLIEKKRQDTRADRELLSSRLTGKPPVRPAHLCDQPHTDVCHESLNCGHGGPNL